MNTENKKRTKKVPRKISAQYLENAALFYLQRYASSAANLRRVLLRKINRSCKFHDVPAAPFTPLVDGLLTRYIAVGLLNDESYARAKAQTLRRAGKSRQAIHAKLAIKGLSTAQIEDALHIADEESDNAELTAAQRHAKKKRIGIYRTDGLTQDPALKQKELAVLARAGFSYEIARKALYEENIADHQDAFGS